MPTRKQRRRQEKLRRHEWEEVWVDSDGQEVDVDPAELDRPKPAARQNGAARQAKQTQKPRTRDAKGRPIREIQPPSWRRTLKRAAIFLPLMVIVLSLTNTHASPVGRVLVGLFYGVLLIPMMYLMDRMTYRTYLRRTGRTPPQTERRPKR